MKIDSKKIEGEVLAKFVTERKIKSKIINLLKRIEADDIVRLQMFYLSDLDVVEEILNASTRVNKPIRILLDPLVIV